jgi:hypothetical protein
MSSFLFLLTNQYNSLLLAGRALTGAHDRD